LKTEDILTSRDPLLIFDLDYKLMVLAESPAVLKGAGCPFKKPSSISTVRILQSVIQHNKWGPVCSVFPRNPSDAGFSN